MPVNHLHYCPNCKKIKNFECKSMNSSIFCPRCGKKYEKNKSKRGVV